MRPSDASVVIRPRNTWEAIDLGVLLARKHAGLLMLSWALVTLPLFALLCLLFWDYPTVAVLLFWWLKPAYERLPLFILSNALFGAIPTLRQAIKALPGLLRPQLLASLTLHRFSLTRSFDLPVMQLEGLAGDERKRRLVILQQRNTRPASWLTIIGVHLESALWIGGISLFYMLMPGQMETNWQWAQLIDSGAQEWLWLEHLSNFVYALGLVIWGPVYVACGFTLYLNRRTELEAWDIELVFRQLAQRLRGVAAALLLSCCMLFQLSPDSALATENSAAEAETSCPVPDQDPNGPLSDRLLNQPLTSQAAQDSVNNLLTNPPFQHREQVTRWRLGDEQSSGGDDEQGTLSELLKGFFELMKFWQHINAVAELFEALLWALMFGLIGWLIWRYREWLATFTGRLGLPQKQPVQAPQQLFGLDLAPQNLPEDIAAEAERLWDEQPRAALSLLYRGLLSRLVHEYRLPLEPSHTESEVLHLVERIGQDQLGQFSQSLTGHWQNLAYGHRLPPAELKHDLCTAWRQLFKQEVQA
ncbi:DUF4129 domain-containing protein [Ectopseudomonas mendocina]|uniref:DUF4129 domain-containing protein n=1 Tax=Ectopseudomonas mendocina TaxID=300 RepID=A0ABZ2RF02_ECTME